MMRSDELATEPKSKRKRGMNPLSQARGKQQRHENIWFRRSGAGYDLFVQYYMQQPAGTVCGSTVDGDDLVAFRGTVRSGQQSSSDAQENNSNKQPQPQPQPQQQQRGMSRAAKKRRKKKKNTKPQALDDATPQTTIEPSNSQTTTTQLPTLAHMETLLQGDDRPLLQAWSKHSKSATDNNNNSKNASLAYLPFFHAFSRPLPLTLRLRKSLLPQSQLDDVRDYILKDDTFRKVAWSDEYSEIYQATSESGLFKAALSQQFPKLHRQIVAWSESGVLARQEIGSMLPVMVLYRLAQERRQRKSNGGDRDSFIDGLRYGARVVDMCASPGSKTMQALEIIAGAPTKTKKPGRIIANDILQSRLDSLQQAVQRSGIADNLIERITYSCQDASKIELPTTRTAWNILVCDVPCSGDGTIRKDKHVLPMWKPQLGNELHTTQLRILVRALQLMPVGGIVCYSTCSLNPIEDEAVVAAALRKVEAVELLDMPQLNGFTHRPGISTWRVATYLDDGGDNNKDGDKDGAKNDDEDKQQDHSDSDDGESAQLKWFASWQEARECNQHHALPKTLWSTQKGQSDTNESLHLERCVRLWPQDHDTGGFFLALFTKTE